jgi:UDP-glucose 4-epimerase
MKVLITGGFGYLGGRLGLFLASRPGHEVLLGSRQKNESPLWLPHVMVVQSQWNSTAGLEQICLGVDTVVHLAGMNAQECATDPSAALEFNAGVTARLLQAAVRQGVKRFIYLSTAHVYGSPLTDVITEETRPSSLHPYATSHRAGEDVVREANQRGVIEGIVIRLSNAYGAPAHKGANCWMLLVNDLCRQAATTGAMTLRSSGMQRRDFVPLQEACRAIEHLLRSPLQDLRGDVFNLGGEWSPTVWEMACLVQQRCTAVLGITPTLTRVAPQADEVTADLEYRLDALRGSGFHPEIDRIGEIDRLLEFCQAAFPVLK